MATPIQNQTAVNTALQQAATDDLPLLQAFAAANGTNFNTIQTNLTTLMGQISSVSRITELGIISKNLSSVLSQFTTLIALTNIAKTATPGG